MGTAAVERERERDTTESGEAFLSVEQKTMGRGRFERERRVKSKELNLIASPDTASMTRKIG
jgi:hypothetical protein